MKYKVKCSRLHWHQPFEKSSS